MFVFGALAAAAVAAGAAVYAITTTRGKTLAPEFTVKPDLRPRYGRRR